MVVASNEVLENLRRKIREEMNDLANHVDGGGCRDFAEYKHATGKIEGYAFAEKLLLEVDQMISEAEHAG